jgi:secreted Zn-dependent insulinase-like peptidase
MLCSFLRCTFHHLRNLCSCDVSPDLLLTRSLRSRQLFAGLSALPVAAADAGRLARVRESLLRRLRNALVKPIKHAGYLRLRALRARAQPLAAQLAAIEAADAPSLAAHTSRILAHCSVDALVMGNVTAPEASALVAAAAAALPPGGGVSAEAWPLEAVLRVPDGGALIFATARNAAEDNSVCESYFQVGRTAAPSPQERALADLATQASLVFLRFCVFCVFLRAALR